VVLVELLADTVDFRRVAGGLDELLEVQQVDFLVLAVILAVRELTAENLERLFDEAVQFFLFVVHQLAQVRVLDFLAEILDQN